MVPRPRFATWEEFNAHLLIQCQKQRERKLAGTPADNRRAVRERPGEVAALASSTVRSLRQAFHSGDVDVVGALSHERLLGAGVLGTP